MIDNKKNYIIGIVNNAVLVLISTLIMIKFIMYSYHFTFSLLSFILLSPFVAMLLGLISHKMSWYDKLKSRKKFIIYSNVFGVIFILIEWIAIFLLSFNNFEFASYNLRGSVTGLIFTLLFITLFVSFFTLFYSSKNHHIKVMVLVGFLLFSTYFYFAYAKSGSLNIFGQIPPSLYCDSDSDCVPNSHCHPTWVVNNKYFDQNQGGACTADCVTILDCGYAQPVCTKNMCTIKMVGRIT